MIPIARAVIDLDPSLNMAILAERGGDGRAARFAVPQGGDKVLSYFIGRPRAIADCAELLAGRLVTSVQRARRLSPPQTAPSDLIQVNRPLVVGM